MMTGQPAQTVVLILVVVGRGLVQTLANFNNAKRFVLILVVVGRGLVL